MSLDSPVGLRPLAQRILDDLPGPPMLWTAAWALAPWLNAGANLLLDTGERGAVWEQGRAVVIVNYATLSFAILVTLRGAERLARQVEALGATTSKVLTSVPKAPFREMNSSGGPLFAATATAVAFAVSALIRDGWVAALLRGATWLVLGIAIWTFLWT